MNRVDGEREMDGSGPAAEAAATGGAPVYEDAIWCCEVELSTAGPLKSVVAASPERRVARVLVRLHGEPLGYVTVPLSADQDAAAQARSAAWRLLPDRIVDHLSDEGLAPVAIDDLLAPPAGPRCANRVASTELVSVVVCTRNRGEILADCLERLGNLTYEHLEIIIVDNAPTDDSTHRLVTAVASTDPRFRYVVEPRPGLSCARNKGLSEARGRYVAYTDDDVAVDEHWVEGLLRGFAEVPGVGCVTGLACTAGIDSAAEAYFDARSPSWSTRCETEIFDLDEHRRDGALYPYSPGIYGTGANCAFDTRALAAIGPFDEALGAGTRTKGGEDLDMFLRVVLSGRALVYQPAAIVWHHHRADRASLLKQMFGYGTGLTAFVAKCLMDSSMRSQILRRVPSGLWRVLAIRADTKSRLTTDGTTAVPAPKGALARELLGCAAGPYLYFRARRDARAA